MELVKRVFTLIYIYAAFEIATSIHVEGNTEKKFQLAFIGAQDELGHAVCSCKYLRKFKYNMAQMCYLYEGQTCLVLEHKDIINAGISENYMLQISYPNLEVIASNLQGDRQKLVLENINSKDTESGYWMSAESLLLSMTEPLEYELVLAVGPVEWTIQIAPYTEGHKGDNVTLTCSYGQQWHRVRWLKGEHPERVEQNIKNETGRYVSRGLSLDIINLTSDDAGSYFCGVEPLHSDDTKDTLYGRTTLILGEIPQQLSDGFQFPKLNCNQTLDIQRLGTCTFSYLHTSGKYRSLVSSLYEGQSCIIPRHADFANSGMANNLQISYLNHTVATKPAGSSNCDPHFDTTYGDIKQGVILNMTRSVKGVYKLSAATPSLAVTDEADLVVYMVPKEATVQTSSYVTLNIGGETILPFVYGKEKRQVQCKKGTDLQPNATVDLVSLRFHDASGKMRNESGRFAITDSSVIIKNTIPSDEGMYFFGVDPLEGGDTLWSTTIVLNLDVVGDQIPEGTPTMSLADDQSTPEGDLTKPTGETPCTKSTWDRDTIIALSCFVGLFAIVSAVFIYLFKVSEMKIRSQNLKLKEYEASESHQMLQKA